MYGQQPGPPMQPQGPQIQVKINGKTPENFVKDKVSSMIWGWIIGGIILALIVITLAGVGIYVAYKVKTDDPGAAKAAAASAWDGKTPLECKGADVMVVTGVTANLPGQTAIKASAACQLTLVNVNLTAGTGIEASASSKVTMTGGSITATGNSVVASANAQVNCTGTKVTGKSKASGNAKVNGAN